MERSIGGSIVGLLAIGGYDVPSLDSVFRIQGYQVN